MKRAHSISPEGGRKVARGATPEPPSDGPGDVRAPSPRAASPEEAPLFVIPRCETYTRVSKGGVYVRERDGAGEGLTHCSGHLLALTLKRTYARLLSGARVLEVGACSGLCGMAAARLGAAKPVYLQEHGDAAVGALAVDACYNGLARATEVVDWAWGTKFPRSLKRRPIDLVLGADVLFTPWETTKLAAALDALHAHSPNLVFLLSVARVWTNAEAQCMAAFSDRGWRTRQLDPHPEDVRAASKGYVDDHLAAGQDRVPAGHLAIYEITKP